MGHLNLHRKTGLHLNGVLFAFNINGADSVSDLQIRREREIQQQMMLQDEETLEMKETFSSLQQEVELKTKKLKKVR